ncbi:MAG: hypothetical protein N2167_01295 [Flavobacteriales bacterium]|nr:hypothetical protein [Flavobacteriales bacterium]
MNFRVSIYWFFILFTCWGYSQTPDWQWAKNYPYLSGFSMEVLASGEILIAGSAKGNFTLGSDVINTNGENYPFLIKFDSLGNYLWSTYFSVSTSSSINNFEDITVDGDGNIYVSGWFTDTLFHPLGFIKTSGYLDAFIAKFSTSGSLIWIKKMGGTGENSIRDITLDANHHLWIAGYYHDALELDNDTLYSPISYYTIYIAKLDTSGQIELLKSYHCTERLYVNTIAADQNGNVLIGGSFTGTVDWDGELMINGSADFTDPYLIKFNSQGDILWTKRAWSSFDDEILDVKIASDNSIYVTGTFSSTLNFVAFSLYSAGASDMFVAKYNSNGLILWGQSAGGTNWDSGNQISLDHQGSVYVWGSYNGSATFGNTVTLFSMGYNDMYVAKYDVNGYFLWVNEVKNILDGATYGLDLTPPGKIIVMGMFGESLIVGDTMMMAPTYDSYDLFLAQLDNAWLPDVTNYISSENTNNTINFYPNPSQGALSVNVPWEGTYHLYNSLGVLINSYYLNANQTHQIMIENAGLYYFKYGLTNTAIVIIISKN